MDTTEVQQYVLHLEKFMDKIFHHSDEDQEDASLGIPVKTDMENMDSTRKAVEIFVAFCILMFAKGFGAYSVPGPDVTKALSGRSAADQERLLSTSLPISMWKDNRRLQITLLRF
ncbi:hypothetical protein VTL71DRAFT_14142 [Oculimacula yallundae]|uniref:Uncharacterized protein n=1 Tax=Oculimacula yallundae TaxID=86028 RepID=A0ABR4CHR9_9HELO